MRTLHTTGTPGESKCNQRPDDSRRVRTAATLEERTREAANGWNEEGGSGMQAGLKKSRIILAQIWSTDGRVAQ